MTGALADLLAGYSTEVTTRDEDAIKAAIELRPQGSEVFIAALPRDEPTRQVRVARRLREAGLTPVPHIVARNLRDRAALDELLRRLHAEAEVSRALVLGGDRETPAGDFHCALQLIRTGLFEAHGVRDLSIGCYPEGHPRIAREALDASLRAKVLAADEAGLAIDLISQFCFSAPPIVRFARRLRDKGIEAPLRVGVAGPANRATLLRYALMCGVGRSLKVLREQQGLAQNALGGVTPEAVLRGVAAAREEQPALGVSGAHFFTFGSLAASVRFAASLTTAGDRACDSAS
jgi:methylenetetrahydrofolate reductase (NADPH)